MSCTRGAADPGRATRYRLFADSAGRCQNPACLAPLFVELPTTGDVHFGEIAHVIAASAGGPRANPETPASELGAWSNLILLCANCHTMVDRAPSDFPEADLVSWKTMHLSKIEAALGLATYDSRTAARAAIEPFQDQNRFIHEARGPDNDYRADPESEIATMWRRDVAAVIIPNQRAILRVVDANRDLLTNEEKATVERFRMHLRDLEGRHVHRIEGLVSERYPIEMDQLYAN